jgi:glycosyltransferase involved in cell wall biosynthesis
VDRAAIVALVAGRLLDLPYSLTAHANDIYVNPVLLNEKVAEARFITTCTSYNKQYLLKILPRELHDKVHLLYHGLDLSAYQPPSSNSTQEPWRLLSIGRLTEKKGFQYLIAACQKLNEQGYNFVCHIIGEGPLHQDLETQIAQLNLTGKVVLCGAMPFEKVLEQYRQATLFVLPCIVAKDGDRDGIPNVLIEAMAMQLPVISTNISGIPELIRDKDNGLMVTSGDEADLAQTLAKLLDQPTLCKQLAIRGRQTVLEEFEVVRNVQHLFDLFIAERDQPISP